MGRLLVALALLVATRSAGAQPEPWSPLAPDGWPIGVSLEQVRGLPECQTGELVVAEGALVGCRPPVVAGDTQLAFGVDWSSGPAFGSDATSGGAHALGLELAYAATRGLQLAARYELIGIGTSTMAVAGGALGHHAFGLAKWRLFTDEVGRNAWTLGAGAGWAARSAALGSSSPIARVSLAREVGSYLDDENSLTGALELAYERTLDDGGLSALLMSYRLGFEVGIREPHNVGSPTPARNTWRTFSGDAYVGNALGLGVSLGMRATEWLSLQTSAGFQFGTTEFSKQHGFEGAGWSVIAGPRLARAFSQVAPYVQLQAGPVWQAREDGADIRGLAHTELGIRGLIGCSAADVGIWLRGDIEEREATSGGLVMRVVLGAPEMSFAGYRGNCGKVSRAYFATRPPPPPLPLAPLPPPSPPPPVVAVPGVTVDAGAAVAAEVAVEVRPIVVDVILGVALPGLSVRIDPRVLPLERLRAAGYVTIELSGASHALAGFRAQLDGTITRSGLRVDAWTSVATGDSTVRARITIWPAGSRP